MIALTLAEVAAATGGRLHGATPDTVVEQVTTDSRAVPPRSLFVALRGERHDGHDHAGQACGAGALAVLAERPIGDLPTVVVADGLGGLARLARLVRERVDPVVVALTGSVGKTTTKDLAAAALRARLDTVAAPGSYNNEVGVPLTCLLATADTEALVVEVGARGAGHIAALMPTVQPDVAIVTAVAGAHLEMFGNLDAVAAAKGELVEALSEDGAAILNADDPRVAAMRSRTRARVLTFGVHQAADLGADGVRLDRLARPSFVARTPWGAVDVTLPLAGVHHVGNALAALGAAATAGVPVADAAAALATAPLSAWRSEVREADGVVVLNDAYNANPASVRAALDTATAVDRHGRLWAVLGYMAELGASERRDHEDVGRRAAELGVDHLVVVGDRAAAIADGARAAGHPACDTVTDAAAALALLRRGIAPGDVVLVKGSRIAGLEAVASGLLGEGAR